MHVASLTSCSRQVDQRLLPPLPLAVQGGHCDPPASCMSRSRGYTRQPLLYPSSLYSHPPLMYAYMSVAATWTTAEACCCGTSSRVQSLLRHLSTAVHANRCRGGQAANGKAAHYPPYLKVHTGQTVSSHSFSLGVHTAACMMHACQNCAIAVPFPSPMFGPSLPLGPSIL